MAFLDALHLPQAVLIGHSFGGLVIRHFVARHPVRALALMISNTFAANLVENFPLSSGRMKGG